MLKMNADQVQGTAGSEEAEVRHEAQIDELLRQPQSVLGDRRNLLIFSLRRSGYIALIGA